MRIRSVLPVLGWLFAVGCDGAGCGAGTSAPPEAVADAEDAATERKAPEKPKKIGVKSYKTLDAGVGYQDLKKGPKDAEMAEVGSLILVDFVGWVEQTGEAFTTTYTMPEPGRILVGKGMLTEGFDIGVVGMRVGGRRQIRVPSAIGYKTTGRPPRVAPNADLLFMVELRDVLPPRVAPKSPAEVPEDRWTVLEGGTRAYDFMVGGGLWPRPNGEIKFDYTVWRDSDGERVTSSLDRGEPVSLPLGRGLLPPGVELGIIGMQVGGRRQLKVPAAQAYGAEGRPPNFPPNADLTYEIELVWASEAGPHSLPNPFEPAAAGAGAGAGSGSGSASVPADPAAPAAP